MNQEEKIIRGQEIAKNVLLECGKNKELLQIVINVLQCSMTY